MLANNTTQQLFFASINTGDSAELVQFDCKPNQKSKLSVQKLSHDFISQKDVLASPTGFEDNSMYIICKQSQVEDIKKFAQSNSLQLKPSKVDPWVIESSVLSYIRIQLQQRGWNRLNGMMLKGDLFATAPTNLLACNMDMNVQQDAMTISIAYPHSARYRPLNLNTISDKQIPPAQCVVLPTMSSGFIAKIFKSPPFTNSLFRTEEDFKSYWLSAHGLVIPKIEAYVQVRLSDMELTYPSCCLWDSKLSEVRSHSADTSLIVNQLIEDLKDIKLFSSPLLEFKETPTPVAPKVAWIKSSAMLKSAIASDSISDLPNIQEIAFKPAISRPIAPTSTTTITTSTENPPTNTTEKDKLATIPVPRNDAAKPKETFKGSSGKKTLGPKKRKPEPQAKVATKPKGEEKNKADENKKKEATKPIKSIHGKLDESTEKDESIPNVAIDDILAFDDVLDGDKESDKPENNQINTSNSEDPQQSSKKHARDEETTTKSKRSKVEVDLSKLDFSVENLNSRTVHELQAFCRKEKLKISGTKPDLVIRLKDFLEKGTK